MSNADDAPGDFRRRIAELDEAEDAFGAAQAALELASCVHDLEGPRASVALYQDALQGLDGLDSDDLIADRVFAADQLVFALRRCGRADEAIQLAGVTVRRYLGSDELSSFLQPIVQAVCIVAEAFRVEGRPAEALLQLRQARARIDQEDGLDASLALADLEIESALALAAMDDLDEALGRLAVADELVEHAGSDDPTVLNLLTARAWVLQMADRFSEGMELLEQGLATLGDDVASGLRGDVARLEQAEARRLLDRSEDAVEAERLARAAIEHGEASAWTELAWALERQRRRTDEEIDAWSRVIEHDSANASLAALHLSDLHSHHTGDAARARTLLAGVMDEGGEHSPLAARRLAGLQRAPTRLARLRWRLRRWREQQPRRRTR